MVGRTKRKLAAIVSADVVGYSRLMGADETGTLESLRAHRSEIIDPKIQEHGGRIVKTMGDGLLLEFPSVVEAVLCAVEIQDKLAVRNADLPEDRRIALRIGVNLGDIIIEGDDIFGDGVNVAARLEALAKAGGICLSRSARDQVRDKLDIQLEDMGEIEVKNIARPIRVFSVRTGTAQEAGGAYRPTAPTDHDRTSEPTAIAVLPFDNMSGDPEQEYFADGIAEEIITSLSKLSRLLVIARNSSFSYKGKAVKVQEIGEELGVRYVIEGGVRKAGNRVRITVQLIDCSTGGHLWAERFDKELADIFAVQDEVTQEVVSAMAVKLTPDEQTRIKQSGTDNMEAYDCFLRGREYHWLLSKKANAQAKAMLARSVELDPEFAPSYAFLADAQILAYVNRWDETGEQALERAYDYAQKAVALDEGYAAAHGAVGHAFLWKRQHDRAIAAYRHALAVDPSYARGHVGLGRVYLYAGRSAEAIEAINRGIRLNPHYPDIFLHFLAQANFQLGHYKETIEILQRRLIRNPDTDISRVLLAACYGHLGRTDEAKAEWAEVLRINPDYSIEHRRHVLPYKDPSAFDMLVEGLRKAGLQE